MSDRPKFCPSCGAPVVGGGQFCGQCGQALASVGAPVATPTASAPAATFPPLPPAPAVQQPLAPAPAATGRAKKGARVAKAQGGNTGTRILVILVGLLLVFFGLRGPIAMAAGTGSSAVVTSVDQDYDSEENQYTYTVSYRFTTDAGKAVNGSYNVTGYSPSGLPAEGSLISITYLEAAPFINQGVGRGPNPFLGLLLAALGAALILFNSRFHVSRG